MLTRAVVLVLITVAIVSSLAGCSNAGKGGYSDTSIADRSGWQVAKPGWQSLTVYKSTAADVAAVFRTPVSKGDRYAYALREDKLTDSVFLMMVDLDEDGIVTAKYYWEWIATPQFLAKLESWEMAMDMKIPASVLQEYTTNLGPKEEAILDYLGGRLRDIAAHFENLKQLFGATGSMKRILTMAATEYNMRADKQALLSERGFVFDGDVFGDECTISLKPIDERAGWYFLVLKGHRIKNFFSGW